MAQSYPSRPPLNRGRTLPAYLARELVSQPGQPPSTPAEKGSQSTLLDNTRSNGSDRIDPNRDYSQSVPGSPLQGHHHWQSVLPPTPPSTSPGSEEMYAQSPFSSYSSSSSSSSSGSAATATNSSNPPRTYRFSVPARSAVSSNPDMASSSPPSSPSSVFLRSARVPSTHENIHVFFEVGETDLSFSAPIGPGFDTACITISARKNNCVDIVADRWEVNRDCRFEWNVQFTNDADMSRIKAHYENGLLSVVAPRRTMYQPPYRGRPTPYPSAVAGYRRT